MNQSPRVISRPAPAAIHVLPFGDRYEMVWDKKEKRPAMRRLCFDRDLLQRLAAQANSEQTDIEIDWNHLSFACRVDPTLKNPAAAWLASGSWRVESDGLWADVRSWTPAGEASVRSGEYRYVSAGIDWLDVDAHTGAYVSRVNHVSLTNQPALDGLTPLSAARGGLASPAKPVTSFAAGRAAGQLTGGMMMLEKLLAMCGQLGIAVAPDADADACLAALDEHCRAAAARVVSPRVARRLGHVGPEPMTEEQAFAAIDAGPTRAAAALSRALGADDGADWRALVAHALTLRQNVQRAADVDRVVAENSALARQRIVDELDALVKDGRLAPADRGDYEALLLHADPAVAEAARSALSRLPPRGPLSPPLGPAAPAKQPADAADALLQKIAKEKNWDIGKLRAARAKAPGTA